MVKTWSPVVLFIGLVYLFTAEVWVTDWANAHRAHSRCVQTKCEGRETINCQSRFCGSSASIDVRYGMGFALYHLGIQPRPSGRYWIVLMVTGAAAGMYFASRGN